MALTQVAPNLSAIGLKNDLSMERSFLCLDLIIAKVVGVPAVLPAEEGGDQFDAEFGGLVLLVLEGVVFDDVDADDVAVAADVFGNGSDLAIGQAFGVWHAGAGGVQAVDAVEIQADPDVRCAPAERVDLGE